MALFNVSYGVCYQIEADNLDEAVMKVSAHIYKDSRVEFAELQAVSWEDDNGDYREECY